MRYEITKDLETGNALIDSEHRELFLAINNLLDSCASGKGRENIESTVKFLNNYVKKHFFDEEQLQLKNKYPGYEEHKQFHEKYKKDLKSAAQEILEQGPTFAALSKVNKTIGVLVSHIRTEDKKVAAHIKAIASV